MQTLKLNSTGTDVRTLQQYLGITVDGQFGPKTEAAVRKYQTEHNLVADGIVGAKTWASILNTPAPVPIIHKHLGVHITPSKNRPIKYLAIHFTGSSNSKAGRAQSTYNTFVSRKASADFCVDDRDIVQFNPDIRNNYCWAVGDSNYHNNGGSLYGKATNKNTISIEICSTCFSSVKVHVDAANHSGWSFTDAALDNAAALARYLMQTYNIPLENVVRHYDISGKLCPGIPGWNNEPLYTFNGTKYVRSKDLSNSDAWQAFKARLK